MTLIALVKNELITDSLVQHRPGSSPSYFTQGQKLFLSVCGRFAYAFTGAVVDPRFRVQVFEPFVVKALDTFESATYIPPIENTAEHRKILQGSEDDDRYQVLVLTKNGSYHTHEGELVMALAPMTAFGTGGYMFLAGMALFAEATNPLTSAFDFVERWCKTTKGPLCSVAADTLKPWVTQEGVE